MDYETLALILGLVDAGAGYASQQGQEEEAGEDRDVDIWKFIERMMAERDERGDRNDHFAATFGLSAEDARQRYGRDAVSLQGRIDSAPLRDQSQYALMSRIGNPPSAVQPRDITRGGTQSLRTPMTGGVDLDGQRRRMQNYRPGMGGVTTDVDRQILARMLNPNVPGYTPPPRSNRPLTGGIGQPRARTNQSAPMLQARPESTGPTSGKAPVRPAELPNAPHSRRVSRYNPSTGRFEDIEVFE